jgi:hypothetical protein
MQNVLHFMHVEYLWLSIYTQNLDAIPNYNKNLYIQQNSRISMASWVQHYVFILL